MILQFPDMYNLIDIPLKIGKNTHTQILILWWN